MHVLLNLYFGRKWYFNNVWTLEKWSLCVWFERFAQQPLKKACSRWAETLTFRTKYTNMQPQRITVRGECEIITKCECVVLCVFLCGFCFRSQRDCHTNLNRTKNIRIKSGAVILFSLRLYRLRNCYEILALCLSCCLNWINASFFLVLVNNYSYYVILTFIFPFTSVVFLLGLLFSLNCNTCFACFLSFAGACFSSFFFDTNLRPSLKCVSVTSLS